MRTNQKLNELRKESGSEEEDKSKQRLEMFDLSIKYSDSHETEKMHLEKIYSGYSIEKKRSKQDVVKRTKSLKSYMKRNWKMIIIMFFFHTITFGAILSTPIVLNHFSVTTRDKLTSQNQTEKERFIARAREILRVRHQ